jgi:hypothetical protein
LVDHDSHPKIIAENEIEWPFAKQIDSRRQSGFRQCVWSTKIGGGAMSEIAAPGDSGMVGKDRQRNN